MDQRLNRNQTSNIIQYYCSDKMYILLLNYHETGDLHLDSPVGCFVTLTTMELLSRCPV